MLHDLEIVSAGVPRRVLIERAEHVRPGSPLVVMHHGAYQTPEMIRRRSHLGESLVASHGAVVAYPAGRGRVWFADWQLGEDRGGDVELFDSIIDEAHERWDIDRSLVIAAGFSNGGMFSMRLACERAAVLAGVVTSCSSMRMSLVQCPSTVPVPIRMRHGRFDPVVHYARPHRSPIGRLLGGSYVSEVMPAEQTLEFWRRRHGDAADVRLTVQSAGHGWLDGSTDDVRELLDAAGAVRC